ncbi:MAG: amino acid permease [Pirellulales bacterium]
MSESTELNRSLGLPLITMYGLGTIVGGGFYALLGKVVGQAGMLAPVAVLAAALIAMFSALSYAELSARYPYSAGEAHYTLVAFRRLWPSVVVGWAVIATGVMSAATLADAFVGFVGTLADIPATGMALNITNGRQRRNACAATVRMVEPPQNLTVGLKASTNFRRWHIA